MDETTHVEATPIDGEISVITKAERWLSEVTSRVELRKGEYKPPERIEDEGQRKDCIAARAQVRKDAAEIDAERKAMLRSIEDTLKTFKASVKDVLAPLTDLDTEYKRLLDEYEAGWKVQREIELATEYADLAPDLVPLVPFERINAKFGMEPKRVWLNRSTNVVLAKQMLAEAVETIAQGEQAIREQVQQEDVQDALVSYFQSLDLQQALFNARKLREQRENLARLEAERKAREEQWSQPQPVQQSAPQPTQQSMADVPHPWVISIPSATKQQMLMVADFMRSQGIVFDRIYSGTLVDAFRKGTFDA